MRSPTGRSTASQIRSTRRFPVVAADCYTIWNGDGRYLYAGMAGRSLTVESIATARAVGRAKPTGLLDRAKRPPQRTPLWRPVLRLHLRLLRAAAPHLRRHRSSRRPHAQARR